MWRLRSKVSLKPLPQKVHRYRLTSEWHFMWRFRSLCKLKVFEHTRHMNLLLSSSMTVKERKNVGENVYQKENSDNDKKALWRVYSYKSGKNLLNLCPGRRGAIVPGGGSFSLTSCRVVSVGGARGFLMP